MKLYHKIIIVSIVLSSVGLFHIRGLGIFIRLLDIISISLIIGTFIAYILYGKKEIRTKRTFTIPVLIILAGVFLSTLPAQYANDQSIGITLYQQRHMYAFLFYFLLFYIGPDPKWIIKLIFYISLTAAAFFIIQYLLYPDVIITDAKIFTQRGSTRINLPGYYYMYIGFFLSVDRFFTNYKIQYGIGAMLFFLVAIISGFRTTIASYILITTGFLLLSKRIKNKFLFFFIVGLFAISAFFAFQGIVMEAFESAEKETAEGTENIRYRAGAYLLSLNESDRSTYILGNGEPSERSIYGIKLWLIAIHYGYYLSDIGIFGFYFKFGIFAALAVLYITLKIIFSKLDQNTSFLRLFFIYQSLVIANTLLSFDSLPDIIAICMLLYLFDSSKEKVTLKNFSTEKPVRKF